MRHIQLPRALAAVPAPTTTHLNGLAAILALLLSVTIVVGIGVSTSGSDHPATDTTITR